MSGFLRSPNPRVLGASAVASTSLTGSTSETILATIVIPGKAMGPNGIVRVTMVWRITNNANAKTGRVRHGGIGGTIFAAQSLASTRTTRTYAQFANVNSEASQKGPSSGISTGWGGSSADVVTASIDTTVAQDLVITGQLADGADTLTLESYVVEILVP